MANFFREEIDQLGERLNGSIQVASRELQARVDDVNTHLEAHRREGLEAMSERLDGAIRLAGTELQRCVLEVSQELHTHRGLTKSDLRELIDYANTTIGIAIDQRIDKLKAEASVLVTDKVLELRDQLTKAVEEQKASTLRNVVITLMGSVLIGGLSLVYQQVLHGQLNLINVFRALLFTAIGSQSIWFAVQAIQRYRRQSEEQKKLLIAATSYLGVFRTQGVLGHLVLFALMLGALLLINFWRPLLVLIQGGR